MTAVDKVSPGPSTAGLSSVEAARRLAADGPNQLPGEAPAHGLVILARQFASPLIAILVAAAALSRALGERIDAFVILGIVAVNALLGFVQEYRAERTVRALRRFITRTARVRRDGRFEERPTAELVVGDVVDLELGDLLPADLTLLEADDLAADESALSGESVPVAKSAGDAAWLGTTLVSGSGTGVVTAVGGATRFGRTAGLVRQRPEETDFQRNLRRLSGTLVWVILALTLAVFGVNAAMGKGWFESFLFALALAVGITPEALPVIVTIALSRGASRMAREHVVVKRLVAVEDLGNIDLLCCDKTGTLTEGAFALDGFVTPRGDESEEVLLLGALAGTDAAGTPDGPAPNPTDRATWASAALDRVRERLARARIEDRHAFDFNRRRAAASAVLDGRRRLVVKGAAESVLPCCRDEECDGTSRPLTEAVRAAVRAAVEGHESAGRRVLVVAERELAPDEKQNPSETDLVLRGFLLYRDPVKPDAKAAIARLGALGVGVKLLSGDSLVVTRQVCREVGLGGDVPRIATGDDVAHWTDHEFAQQATMHDAFARVAPEQKHRLVTALRHGGAVVGFLGDGVNDAPALRAADVGLAVDQGTDIAKEAADIILLRRGLGVIASGIMEGRRTFANVTKYILNTVSANFGNMTTVAASSLFLAFIPLLPAQILLNNFISDLPLVTIATDRVDEDLLARPRHWRLAGMLRFMGVFGALSAVFDLVLIFALLRVFQAGVPLFRTAWFVESACSEILVTFVLRTRLRFFRSVPSRLLLLSSLGAVLLVGALPFTAFGQRLFAFVPLPVSVSAFVAAVLAGYVLCAEWLKGRVMHLIDG
jgi:Mg2+-importing ATPase